VLVGVDVEHLTRRGDELDLADRVDREAMLAHQPADAAPEREPADADVAGVARADAEPMFGESRGDVAPAGTAADGDEAVGSDVDRGELGEVDDEPVVDRKHAMAAAADGDGQAGCCGEADGDRDLVGRVRPNDGVGFADAREHGTAGVILGCAGTMRPAWNTLTQFREDGHSVSLAAAPDMRNVARSARNSSLRIRAFRAATATPRSGALPPRR
jgi:hypothetical protein